MNMITALCLMAFAFVRLALSTTCGLHSVPCWLDDMDTSATLYSVKMIDDGLEQCKAEAHGGHFHHDGATNKGKASFLFQFDVSRDGCYSLEEYHPGSQPECSQLLTTNARLDVDWCAGRRSSLTYDQTKNGGKWNFLAIFPYYVGYAGRIKVSDPFGLEGQHLIVDSFRVTRVGDKCTSALQQQLWKESQARQVQTTASATSTSSTGTNTSTTPSSTSSTSTASKFIWQEGSLQLTLQVTRDKADLLARLKTQKGLLEATLQNHFQARTVVVKAILLRSDRRLAGCSRRLEASGETFDFDVHFKAQVPTTLSVAEPALASELATALASAGAEFKVESVELHWIPIDAGGDTPEPDAGVFPWPVILVCVVAAVLLALLSAGFARWAKRVGAISCKEAQEEVEAGQAQNIYDETDPPKKTLEQLHEADDWKLHDRVEQCKSKWKIYDKTHSSKKSFEQLDTVVQGCVVYDPTDPPHKILEQLDDNASTATPDSDTALKDLENISVCNSVVETE